MMYQAVFDTPTCIADQALLRKLFDTDRLYLAPAASVTLHGTITLDPETAFFGDCHLADGTSIGMGSLLTNASLGRGNRVRPHSILTDVRVGDRNLFGPFCFIRDDCVVADDCILGAHVEAARSVFGSGVKISHRAFVGDSTVGDLTIIGAGVVFCNFDGRQRQSTLIGARVTLGSGVLVIPPVSVGNDAIVGAGSVVNKDVPPGVKVIQKRYACEVNGHHGRIAE